MYFFEAASPRRHPLHIVTKKTDSSDEYTEQDSGTDRPRTDEASREVLGPQMPTRSSPTRLQRTVRGSTAEQGNHNRLHFASW